MIIFDPESLEEYQIDIRARRIAKNICDLDFEQCSEYVKVKSYELAVQIEHARFTATLAANVEELTEAIQNKDDIIPD